MTYSVVPYSEDWPAQFQVIRAELARIFAGASASIEHIGSTSVPGLCAKPIIDVLIGADSLRTIEARLHALGEAGYEYVSKYESAFPDRRYFVKPESTGLRVNVHAVRRESEFWLEHIAFRNALRGDARTREAYAALKQHLARVHEGDRPAYTAAKAPFIAQVLQATR